METFPAKSVESSTSADRSNADEEEEEEDMDVDGEDDSQPIPVKSDVKETKSKSKNGDEEDSEDEEDEEEDVDSHDEEEEDGDSESESNEAPSEEDEDEDSDDDSDDSGIYKDKVVKAQPSLPRKYDDHVLQVLPSCNFTKLSSRSLYFFPLPLVKLLSPPPFYAKKKSSKMPMSRLVKVYSVGIYCISPIASRSYIAPIHHIEQEKIRTQIQRPSL